MNGNNSALLVCFYLFCISLVSSFQVTKKSLFSRNRITRNEKVASEQKLDEDVVEKVKDFLADAPNDELTPYVGNIQSVFPGAMSNLELEGKVVTMLSGKGFTPENTLLATSLCCDELARRLEDDFVKIYGNNFNLGGLSGFPFAGNTGFGAMAAHIPDNGSCLIIYGPHVGIAKSGEVGKVERRGIKLLDNCCGSAIAASNYLKSITDGGAPVSIKIKTFTDFQQGAVQELILPHGKRLSDAENRMVELPRALYASQDLLMQDIVKAGAAGAKKNGIALLGGIQINTAPDTLDYFLPLRFDLMNSKGEVVESLLSELKGEKKDEEYKKAQRSLIGTSGTGLWWDSILDTELPDLDKF